SYNVDAIRIAIASDSVPSWNEIDAVDLQTAVPPGNRSTTQSGNWSDAATWAGGNIPSAGDTVIVNAGHTVTLDVNTNISSGVVTSGGTLMIPTGTSLTLGPNGGGNAFLQVIGTLNVGGGLLTVNG